MSVIVIKGTYLQKWFAAMGILLKVWATISIHGKNIQMRTNKKYWSLSGIKRTNWKAESKGNFLWEKKTMEGDILDS